MANAEGENESGEGRALALLDGGNEIARRFVRHPFERRKLRNAELVEIGRRAHDPGIDQLIHQLFAKAVEIHRPAPREMQQGLLALRGADQPARAPRDGLLGQPHYGRAAFGAYARHRERRRARRSLVQQDAHDFRDHVAGAADDDRVADVHVLAPHLVLVVQRGVGDGHAADEHWV